MRTITFAQATLEAMAVTMEEDPAVFVMGEDIARQGGIFGQFKDLARQFPDRVIDTPISETFIVGGGVGAALAGAVRWWICTMRISSASQWMRCSTRWQRRGSCSAVIGQKPIVRGHRWTADHGAAQHTQSVEAWIHAYSGLKGLSRHPIPTMPR